MDGPEPSYEIRIARSSEETEGYKDGFADGYSRAWVECWEHMRKIALNEVNEISPDESTK